MKSVETSEVTLMTFEEKLTNQLNRIQELQYEIIGIRKQLDTAIQLAAKQSYPKGEVVSVEKLLAIKELEKPLSIKSTENERLVGELYNSIFPNDIFILQDYFGVWVKINATTVVQFADDLSSIEVKVLGDLS